MALLSRLFPKTDALQTRKVGGIKPVSETPGVPWSNPTASSGVAVDEFEALTISAVFAAAFRLANITAMLPIGVYERTSTGRKELPLHPAVKPLSSASNDEQTAFTARHFMQFWKPLFGSACAEIGWDGAGRPRMLWPIAPWRVDPKYDDADKLYYLIDGKRRLASQDTIYIPHVTQDGVCGQGFVHYALESLGTAIAADRSAGRFYENDMRPGGLLRHPGNPQKEAMTRMKEEWASKHGGVRNRGKVGVLWGGWEWVKEAGMIDPDKAQLLESRQWTVTEVARWMNVPPHWLADLGRATWANIEAQSIEALRDSINPILVATEQEYDRKLLDPPRLYCKHNVNAFLRGDMKARMEFYKGMVEIGVFTQNMALAYEDENGIGPVGDRRFIPVNWQPLDDLMTGGEAQRKAKQTDGPKESKARRPSAAQASALRGVAEHALVYLCQKECLEAKRAAKKPRELNSWMDAYYPDFEARLRKDLHPAARLRAALIDDDEELGASIADGLASRWAADWVAFSKDSLLTAMECHASEWPHRAEQLFSSWETRPLAVATRIGEVAGG